MNSQELKKYNWLNPPKDTLPRKESVLRAYECYQKTEGYNMFIVGLKQKLENEPIVFIPNTFPYDVKHPIKHSCLWYRGILEPKNVESFLRLNNIDYITFFENEPEFKSIKSISHYHIFHY